MTDERTINYGQGDDELRCKGCGRMDCECGRKYSVRHYGSEEGRFDIHSQYGQGRWVTYASFPYGPPSVSIDEARAAAIRLTGELNRRMEAS